MGTFINSNPGIASRIGYTFNFEDYTVEELMDIFKMKVTSSKFEITKEAEDKVLELIRYFHGTENLGNGRFIDKILQHTLQKHACTFNKENINILSEEDVPSINEVIDTMATDDNYRAINLENSTLDEIAYHEIGHFIVGVALGLKSKPIEITINATNSGSLGHVKWDISESSTHKKQDLEYQITECLAGLASEKLKYNEFGTGGSSDLKQATYIAKVMISKLGMSEQGMAYRDMSEIDYTEVNKILDKQMQLASDILKQHQDIIERMYADLIVNKRIDKEQLEAYVKMIKASKNSK